MIKVIKKFPNFLKEVKEELKKVNWSTRQELISAAGVVIVAATFLTGYIATVDLGLSKLIQFLLR